MSRNPIVAAMIGAACASAAELRREQAAFTEHLAREDMAVIVEDFAEWIEAHDVDFLEAAEIDIRQMDDGRLVLVSPRADEPFVIRVHSARALTVNGRILHVNHDLAVLDGALYGELVNRLLDWSGMTPDADKAKRWGGDA